MITVPKEISAEAVKAGAAEKHTPMMQQCFFPMSKGIAHRKPTPKATPQLGVRFSLK